MMKLVSVVGVMAMLAGSAVGQADKPLSGPTVKQDRPAGLGGQFADGKGDRRGPMAETVPMRLYAEAIQQLRGEDAPQGLRLTQEQSTKVGAIEEDFRKSMRAYTQKARQDNARGPRGRPAAGDKTPDEMAPQGEPDRARMQELMRNAPNPTDPQVKIYALLTPAQQKFVDGEVAKGRAELEKRRTEEYMQRQLQKKKGEPGAAPAAPVQPPQAAGEGRERLRRLMERLQELSPQEREQILARLEAELDRRGPAAGQGPRRIRDGDKKPAPKIDDVKIPAPDKRPG